MNTTLDSSVLIWKSLMPTLIVAVALIIILNLLPLLVTLLERYLERKRLEKAGIEDIDRMDGLTFEKYLDIMFTHLGYKTERTAYQGDYGADLVAEKNDISYVVQAKRFTGKVGVKAIQEVVAARGYYKCQRALVVTNSRYTQRARTLAEANDVELWDRNRLLNELVTVSKILAKKNSSYRAESPAGIAATLICEDIEITLHDSPPAASATCVVCGQVLSEKARRYCLTHPQRFGGKVYCYDHQRRPYSPH